MGDSKTEDEAKMKIWGKLWHSVRPDVSTEEVQQTYSDWADTYDRDYGRIGYKPPKLGADEINALYPNNKNIKILDCAAGTGAVAEQLTKLGFTNFDALDANPKMLEKAKEKNLYDRYICAFMGPDRWDIADDTYDVLVTVGSFAAGHANQSCFDELIRVVKPGGHIIIVMREKFLTTADEFRDKLEPKMQLYHDKGFWKWLARKRVAEYHIGAPGIAFVFQVLESKREALKQAAGNASL